MKSLRCKAPFLFGISAIKEALFDLIMWHCWWKWLRAPIISTLMKSQAFGKRSLFTHHALDSYLEHRSWWLLLPLLPQIISSQLFSFCLLRFSKLTLGLHCSSSYKSFIKSKSFSFDFFCLHRSPHSSLACQFDCSSCESWLLFEPFCKLQTSRLLSSGYLFNLTIS